MIKNKLKQGVALLSVAAVFAVSSASIHADENTTSEPENTMTIQFVPMSNRGTEGLDGTFYITINSKDNEGQPINKIQVQKQLGMFYDFLKNLKNTK
ncbi:hypothetical protein [Atopobacter phocae]|uniref:hypothetical protein n=1 Tax=Atopobacter phocae TaxID=136492 RepID=UPI00047076FF|nr:hypothetical protein [Atopobacter phocae]